MRKTETHMFANIDIDPNPSGYLWPPNCFQLTTTENLDDPNPEKLFTVEFRCRFTEATYRRLMASPPKQPKP